METKTVDFSELTQKQKNFRKEVSRLSSIANKRIKRLQNSDLKESPALKKWEREGGEKFGIRGKTQREVRKEFYRVRDYLQAETSTITGTKKVLKNMAENTGIEYSGFNDLIERSKSFFELSNKIEEYQRMTGGYASTFSSTRRWQEINKYIDINDIDLNTTDINSLIGDISDRIQQQHEQEQRTSYDFFTKDWTEL